MENKEILDKVNKVISEEMLEKADLVEGDLANGGKIKPKIARRFFRQLQKRSPLMSLVRVETISEPSMEIPKMGLNGHIVRPEVEATATAAADRAKPTLSTVDIQFKRYKIHVNVPFSVLQDNVEKDGILNTIEDMMVETASSNLSDQLFNSDTAAAPDANKPIMNLTDGIIKLLDAGSRLDKTTYTAGQSVDEAMLTLIIKGIKSQYRANRKALVFMVSADVEEDLRKLFSTRETGRGDSFHGGLTDLTYSGIPIIGDGHLPDNTVLCTNPKNIVWVAHDFNMTMHKVEEADEGIIKLIIRLRYGFNIEELDAAYGVQISG